MARSEQQPFTPDRRETFFASYDRLRMAIDFIKGFSRDPLVNPRSTNEIINKGNEIQGLVARILAPERQFAYRRLDIESVHSFLEIAQEPEVIEMDIRHGQQPGTDKLLMMQETNNMNDSVTDDSLVEAFGLAYVIIQSTRLSGKKVTVHTSENLRAWIVARIIAEVTNGDFVEDPRLTCVNFPYFLSEEQQEFIKRTGGDLGYNEADMDLMAGPGTYQKMTNDMDDLGAEIMQDVDGGLHIIVTHKQQLNAREIPGRPSPLGFGIKGKLFQNGLYQATAA